MNATTQLALMAKAKRVFETDGTFLSFPVLSPLAYPPEKLRFVGPTADIPTLGEFSRLVNQIPRGTVFQQEDTYLWDVYKHLFDAGQFAASTATPEQVAAYERAEAVLHTTTPEGLRQDTPTYQAYRQCRDAWIAAAEEYKAAQVTAETSTDPAVKARWQATDEPALRQKVAQAEATWAAEGFRTQVEDAERAVRAYLERPSAAQLWDEWRSSLLEIIDELNDNPLFAGLSSFPTAFSPADAFDAQWPKFTLTADEVTALIAQAPAELKDVLDLTGAGPQVESVSFEFRSVGLNRPWLRPDIFRARFWRLPANEPPLNDGGSPPQGSCPAYITGVVFARNIVEVTRQPDGGTDRVPIRTMPVLKLRPELIRPRPAVTPVPPVIRDHRTGGGSASPVIRDHRTARPAGVVGGAGFARVAMGVQPAAVRPATRVVSPVDRLGMSAFTVRPRPLPPGTPSPPPAPPAPPPPTASVPTPDITILALICRRLPRCPDPDPSLTWTG